MEPKAYLCLPKLAALLMAAALLPLIASAQLQSGAAWPKEHGNLSNNGVSTGSGANGSLRWTYTASTAVNASAVVDSLNRVFIWAQSEGYLLDGAEGALLANDFISGGVETAPVIDQNGNAIVGDESGKLTSLNPLTGDVNWTYTTPNGMAIESSPTIDSNDVVYFGCDDGAVYAVTGSTGKLAWSVTTGGAVKGCPSVDSGGNVVFGSEDGNVYSVGGQTGSTNWTNDIGGAITTAVAIGSDGSLYVDNSVGSIFSLTSAGIKKWATVVTGVPTAPAVYGSYLFVATTQAQVWGFDDISGASLWTTNTGGAIISTPAVDANLTVYVGCDDQNLYAFSGTTGVVAWKYMTGGAVERTPAIGADGAVYFGSNDGNIYCIDSNSVAKVYTSPNSITGGASTYGVVQLTGKAGPSGEFVSLKSSSTNVTVPATVSVPAGKTGVSFLITTAAVPAAETVLVQATCGYSQQGADLTLNPYPISNFYASPDYISGHSSTHGVIQLSRAAIGSGEVVSLQSNDSNVTVPASVTVPTGKTGVSFEIDGVSVSDVEDAVVTASAGSSKESVTIFLSPYRLSNVYTSPASVLGGNGSVGVVQVAGPSTMSDVISLQSDSSSVRVPASVTIPAGKTGVSFAISTSPVSASVTANITAQFSVYTYSAYLVVTPAPMSNFYVSPSTVTGGSTTHGVVQLGGKSGGNVVELQSSDPHAVVPAMVTVPAGSTGVSFAITTKAVTTSTQVTLTATCNGLIDHATLTLSP